MTVSATATAAAVFFSFVFAATASTAVATASAAFTAHQFEDAFHFLVGCIAHFHYGTFKNQVFTSMRVVQVEYHFIFCDFAYIGIELMAFCIVQHDDVAFEDIVAIEFSIRTAEHRFGHLAYVVFVSFAVSFRARDCKVEVVTFLQCQDFLFEAFQSITDS